MLDESIKGVKGIEYDQVLPDKASKGLTGKTGTFRYTHTFAPCLPPLPPPASLPPSVIAQQAWRVFHTKMLQGNED